MGETTTQLQERELNGGDRVQICQGRRPIPGLLGRIGTVVEVFRLPQDSCVVRIDDDPNRRREWFFYRDEVVISDA
jgi:hypothetical protein